MVTFKFLNLSLKVFVLILLDSLLKLQLIQNGFLKIISCFSQSSLNELKHNESSVDSWRSILKEILLKVLKVIFKFSESGLLTSKLSLNEGIRLSEEELTSMC